MSDNIEITLAEDPTLKEEYKFKVVIVGDPSVGKTNLVKRFLQNTFSRDTKATVGVEFMCQNFIINKKVFKIELWDTAGQERYKSVTKLFLQDTQILLLCYAIDDRQSFNNLEYWYKFATNTIGKKIVLGVAGNKSDLYENEKVKDSEGEKFASEHNGIFGLVSAKENKEGIDKLFESLFKKYIDKENGNNIDKDEDESTNNERKTITIKDNKNKDIAKEGNKKKCCS